MTPVKGITKSSHCLICRGCCYFRTEDQYFGPIMTDKELQTTKSQYPTLQFTVKKHRQSNNIFQINLISSRRPGYLVCPLYNQDNGKCRIYLHRPLDCSLWPIMLVKTHQPNLIDITISQSDVCPSLEKQPDKIQKYSQYIVKKLNSPEFKTLLRRYRELAWEKEDWMISIGQIDISD